MRLGSVVQVVWGSTPHSGRFDVSQAREGFTTAASTTTIFDLHTTAYNMSHSQTLSSQLLAAASASQGQVPSPCPAAPLPDLVPHRPLGEEAECDQTKRGKPRRSVAEMQLEMASRDGFFIEFKVPHIDPAGDPKCDPIEHTKEYKVSFSSICTCTSTSQE